MFLSVCTTPLRKQSDENGRSPLLLARRRFAEDDSAEIRRPSAAPEIDRPPRARDRVVTSISLSSSQEASMNARPARFIHKNVARFNTTRRPNA